MPLIVAPFLGGSAPVQTVPIGWFCVTHYFHIPVDVLDLFGGWLLPNIW